MTGRTFRVANYCLWFPSFSLIGSHTSTSKRILLVILYESSPSLLLMHLDLVRRTRRRETVSRVVYDRTGLEKRTNKEERRRCGRLSRNFRPRSTTSKNLGETDYMSLKYDVKPTHLFIVKKFCLDITVFHLFTG